MSSAILLGAFVVALLSVMYLSGSKKNGAIFTRGAFMRDLNRKMEADHATKAKDLKVS